MPTRRQFIRSTVGVPLLVTLAPPAPGGFWRAAAQTVAHPPATDRVLVVIQLTGGNDGLNTVVPFADDVYARSRPTLRLPPAQLHRLNDRLGLHPRMGALARVFDAGHLAIVQGVGCPELSRDHEAAMRTWQTAAPTASPIDTGWLGRAADRLWLAMRPLAPAAFVGAIPRPHGLDSATVVVPTLRTADDATGGRTLPDLAVPPVEGRGPGQGAAPNTPLLDHVRSSVSAARVRDARIAATESESRGGARYPACGLGRDLQTVARLVRADSGIRIFHTELGGGGIGGFDNHANQLGNHCALLQQLSDSVAAFVADLEADRLLDRVVLLTFSEFGRTVVENGRRGTDHGAAGPMLLVGGRIRGGVHGAHPSLDDLDQGALKHHTDFRAVYATLLEDWLDLPSAALLGGPFNRLPLVATFP